MHQSHMPVIMLSRALLGGSGVVVSGVIGPVLWVVSIVIRLKTLLIATHEPPSRLTQTRLRQDKVGGQKNWTRVRDILLLLWMI